MEVNATAHIRNEDTIESYITKEGSDIALIFDSKTSSGVTIFLPSERGQELIDVIQSIFPKSKRIFEFLDRIQKAGVSNYNEMDKIIVGGFNVKLSIAREALSVWMKKR